LSELQASSSSPESASTALEKLSPIEERFALAYFRNGGNASKAYREIRPDVARSTSYEEGSKLLRKPEIKAAIETLRLGLRNRVQLDTEVLAQRLLGQATGNITDVVEWGGTTRMAVKPSAELTPEEAALIEEIEEVPTEHGRRTKVKLVNRTAAARLLLELRGELVKQVKVDADVVHRVVALPEKLSREQWAEQYAPGRQVQAKVESIEENTR
jgi:phage terminase small subunit